MYAEWRQKRRHVKLFIPFLIFGSTFPSQDFPNFERDISGCNFSIGNVSLLKGFWPDVHMCTQSAAERGAVLSYIARFWFFWSTFRSQGLPNFGGGISPAARAAKPLWSALPPRPPARAPFEYQNVCFVLNIRRPEISHPKKIRFCLRMYVFTESILPFYTRIHQYTYCPTVYIGEF